MPFVSLVVLELFVPFESLLVELLVVGDVLFELLLLKLLGKLGASPESEHAKTRAAKNGKRSSFLFMFLDLSEPELSFNTLNR